MKAVILAAGEGTRLRPVTHYVPKPLIPFVGKPFLQYTLENLVEFVEEVVLVVNYKEERIRETFGPGFRSLPIRYVTQDALRGTGDALLRVREWVDDRFLTVLGDVYVSRTLLEEMIAGRYAHSLALAEVDDPENHLGVAHREGVATGIFTESSWVDRGVWVFSPEIFGYLERQEWKGREVRAMRMVAEMVEAGEEVGVHLSREPWVQIGDHSHLEGVLEALGFFLREGRRDVYCPENDGSSVRSSSVESAVRNCEIEDSLIFGEGRLTNCEIERSLVYVSREVAGERVEERIVVL